MTDCQRLSFSNNHRLLSLVPCHVREARQTSQGAQQHGRLSQEDPIRIWIFQRPGDFGLLEPLLALSFDGLQDDGEAQ